MVIHDLMHLPGFDIIKTYPYNAAVFESEATSERLTVIFANRLPLEEQTGTDLIYFNETFQSFVMVPYTAMEREDGPNGVPQAVFRLPNSQLPEDVYKRQAKKLVATYVISDDMAERIAIRRPLFPGGKPFPCAN